MYNQGKEKLYQANDMGKSSTEWAVSEISHRTELFGHTKGAVTNKQMYNDSDEKKWKIGMTEAEKRH